MFAWAAAATCMRGVSYVLLSDVLTCSFGNALCIHSADQHAITCAGLLSKSGCAPHSIAPCHITVLSGCSSHLQSQFLLIQCLQQSRSVCSFDSLLACDLFLSCLHCALLRMAVSLVVHPARRVECAIPCMSNDSLGLPLQSGLPGCGVCGQPVGVRPPCNQQKKHAVTCHEARTDEARMEFGLVTSSLTTNKCSCQNMHAAAVVLQT
jgi:hypothetical protein